MGKININSELKEFYGKKNSKKNSPESQRRYKVVSLLSKIMTDENILELSKNQEIILYTDTVSGKDKVLISIKNGKLVVGKHKYHSIKSDYKDHHKRIWLKDDREICNCCYKDPIMENKHITSGRIKDTLKENLPLMKSGTAS